MAMIGNPLSRTPSSDDESPRLDQKQMYSICFKWLLGPSRRQSPEFRLEKQVTSVPRIVLISGQRDSFTRPPIRVQVEHWPVYPGTHVPMCSFTHATAADQTEKQSLPK